ncbi:ABC transporter ATP-binding protein/permease [uncultured Ruminococcus sp.]|uniref:ABC transporter ATP-binding protein/permease n=1 Tax=uncultured Ruminococcus sp. TaxID=165186 RepID=UPI0025EA1166|nr:ABC transporter ATP-binding protein/permease [uncultured Ruminococcus sp.]
MLQLRNIRKEYITGDLKQIALDDVSLDLRDNEFVAVLGPSGSGKTTLLNIIGGLDRYDSGDLIINGISTKKYKERDWDSYRNHTIGFVFQNYNLIPHQSILSNVELSLTIAGISKAERKKRAKQALEKVGLGDQCHKRPNQLSGGQMQRVAIARALVNDPDILLADEPTGALDTDTGLQVMDMLAEVANDRLVIMVTHNPELAEKYATRIVRLKDGRITDDSAPVTAETADEKEPEHKNMGKSSMSVVTSLGLSFNNLRTKKGRTLLTSFAGSIGIIGIAMILSMSNGVKKYIDDIQRSTMSALPISIEAQTVDYSALMGDSTPSRLLASGEPEHELDGVYADGSDIEQQSEFTMSITENNLTAFKQYLDDENSDIQKHLGSNGIVYGYDTKFSVFTKDDEGTFVNCNGSTVSDDHVPSLAEISSSLQQTNSWREPYSFEQLIAGRDGSQISDAIMENYELVSGSYPENYDELVLVLNSNQEISIRELYELGVLPTEEYRELKEKVEAGEKITLGKRKLEYTDIIGKEFTLVPRCDMYIKNEKGLYEDISEDNAELEKLAENGIPLHITGIIKPIDDDKELIKHSIGYTKALTNYIIEHTNKSEVVQAQEASPKISVLNGMNFNADTDEKKIADAKIFIKNLNTSEKANLFTIMTGYMNADASSDKKTSKGALGGLLGMMGGMNDEESMAQAVELFLGDPDDEMLLSIYDMYITATDYDQTLSDMGVVSLDAPTKIDIYADTFEAKDAIAECINDYNNSASDSDRIVYTDFTAMLMSEVTTMINSVSYVLIAFVAISLVVSSIMIGIITYISVLERTKEIGILRALGASKKNISQVFNAETFIIGLGSGMIGIAATLILLIPANIVIHAMAETDKVNASLPVLSAFVLIALSIVLTLIGGFIPSKKAALKDPVTALRTE